MADRITTWQRRVCLAVVPPDGMPPRPEWSASGVPACVDSCPRHDGKRCELLGHRPDAICEPVVAAMASRIAELEATLTEALDKGARGALWGSDVERFRAVLAQLTRSA